MTQYLLAVHSYDNEGGLVENVDRDEMQSRFAATGALNDKMVERGVWVFGGGLVPPTSATIVRHQGGDVLITDGPWPETKEHVGGFWVIEASDLDAALDWATQAATACGEAIEVRPFQDEPPLG
jgi:hypothetical protein